LIAGNVNSRRLVTLIYVVILGGLGLGGGIIFVDARAEYRKLQQAESELRRRLNEAESRLAEQERTLERLRTDKDYVARLVRQKLHYAKPGEVIFRFED
jgi:cell division protein FtsB